MRVLHVAESAKGGVGSYLAIAGRHQTGALGRANVRFIVPSQHQDQLTGIDGGCIRGFDRPGRSAGSFRNLAAALLDEVETFDPHVIHLHSTFAGLIVRPILWRRRARPAIIYCPHGWAFNNDMSGWKKKLIEYIEQKLAALSDSVIAISNFEALEARRIHISDAKVLTIPNGVPDVPVAGPSSAWDDRRLKVLFVGRLDRQKGIDLLVDAVGRLQRRVSLRIAGDSVRGSEKLVAPDNVELLGWLKPSAIASQMAACDVVVIPSRWEGFGLVAIEAMRAGKPIIAARVGGLPEVIGEGVSGRLIEPESASAIYDALLAMDLQSRTVLGARGRVRYEARYTAEKMLRALLAHYETVFARRRSGVLPRPSPFASRDRRAREPLREARDILPHVAGPAR